MAMRESCRGQVAGSFSPRGTRRRSVSLFTPRLVAAVARTERFFRNFAIREPSIFQAGHI